ncbi:MAG TPA: sensor histidine kinase [Albitalea sp.]|nr:sensor histidine kinase [Albitalea sp.]
MNLHIARQSLLGALHPFTRIRSLHRQLLLWLLLPQLVLWLAAAAVSYATAARYANKAIDASLSQAARSLARQVKPIGNGLFIDFPRAAQDIIEADRDEGVFYMVSTPPGKYILGNRKLDDPPLPKDPPLGTPHLYNSTVEKMPVRVAALYLAYGDDAANKQTLLVQIARGRTQRDELASEILRDTALPLSGLILLMSMIVWAGIRAGLAPLARLRAAVEEREPHDLAPLQIEAAPAELRSLVGALNGLLTAVQGNVATQRRFISDAAHQLRTPLAGLKSQTELALAENADPALRARLERVHESATRSAHLVAQLLTLARAEPESAAALGRSRFDLRKLAHDLSAEMVPRALKAGVDLGIDESAEEASPGELFVEGNALLVREALANVIDNAIRYSGSGHEVTVRTRPDGGRVVVEVDDTGPGIPGDLHERAFERFFRVSPSGSGCGLGLAIVKEIVERHAGSVTLESLSPHGLRIRMELPLAQR